MLCSKLGGYMALDISQKQFSVGDTTGCNRKYWQPIKLDNYSNDQYFWSGDTHEDVENYINNLNWMNSMPNAYGTEECLDVTELSGNYYANDVECEVTRCSICSVPAVNSFYLRGPGLEGIDRWHRLGLRNFLDHKYSLSLELQENSSHLVFEGENGLSKITWYPLEKTALIKRYDNKVILDKQKIMKINYHTDPFGYFRSLEWVFTGVSSKHLAIP